MIFSQRDPRWANQRLGTNDALTLGSAGCYTTSLAMVATHFNKDTDPARLDDIFTNNNFYLAGYLGTPNILQKAFGDIQFVGQYDCAAIPCDMNQLNAYNQVDRECVIQVDFNHNPADGIQTHFVRMESYVNGVLIVDDPWTGERIDFAARYGNPVSTIQSLTFYTVPGFGAPANPAPPEPPAPTPIPAPEPTVPPAEPPKPVPIVVDPQEFVDLTKRVSALEKLVSIVWGFLLRYKTFQKFKKGKE